MTVAPQYSPIREPGLAVRPAIVVQGLGSPTAPADWHRTEKAPDLIGELYDWYSNQNCFSIEFSMIILKLEFQSSTIYIFENIFMALLVAVVIQFMVQIVQ